MRTESTFIRHFLGKRKMLFDGEARPTQVLPAR